MPGLIVSISKPFEWYAVDLDKTLAKYDDGESAALGPLVIGEPIAKMVACVKQWLKEGNRVSIFTARLAGPQAENDPMCKMQILMAIQAWCQKNIGQVLEATCIKYPKFTKFVDDEAVCVEANTGKILFDSNKQEKQK